MTTHDAMADQWGVEEQAEPGQILETAGVS